MSGMEITETTRKALIMWAVVVRSADADISFALTYGKYYMALESKIRKSERSSFYVGKDRGEKIRTESCKFMSTADAIGKT